MDVRKNNTIASQLGCYVVLLHFQMCAQVHDNESNGDSSISYACMMNNLTYLTLQITQVQYPISHMRTLSDMQIRIALVCVCASERERLCVSSAINTIVRLH